MFSDYRLEYCRRKMETMVSGLIVLWAHRQRTDFCENDGTAINCSVRFSRVQLVPVAGSDLTIGQCPFIVLVLVLSRMEKPAMREGRCRLIHLLSRWSHLQNLRQSSRSMGPELEPAQMIYFIMISCSSESNYLDEQVCTLTDLTKKYMVLMKP